MMGRTINDAMDGVLVRLGAPRAQSPSEDLLLRSVCTQIRTLLRQKQNVSNPWNFDETFVEITPGEDTYQITQANFGTPLVVTTVPQNDNQIIRIVPFYCPQNLNYSWGYPVNAGSWGISTYLDGSNCTAARCAFFWQGSAAFIRFNPTPQISPASYKVGYLCNANGVSTDALTASPLQDQDIDLVECRAAQSVLALTEWESSATKDGRQMNAEKRKDLFVTLANDERLLKEQFDVANRITSGPVLHNMFSTVEV
jgi:hypothetical protein